MLIGRKNIITRKRGWVFMYKKKASVLAGLSLSVALILGACSEVEGEGSDGESYPKGNIEVLVGHGAGGGTDQFARAVAKELEIILGTTINVVNQEGGAGVVALENAYAQPADGYTLIADAAYPITTAAGTNKHGLEDVTPIARVQNDTYILWVNKDTYTTVEELIEDAKANPGKIKVGGTGALGMDEITTGMFGNEADVELNYIPMKGGGEMHAGILGGHLDVMFDEPGPASSLSEAGEIVPLLVLSEERLEAFPEVPTAIEKGWDLTLGNERGFFIKKGADPAIVEKLEEAIKKAAETEAYKKYEKDSYLDLRSGWLGSEDYTKELEKNIELFKEILEGL